MLKDIIFPLTFWLALIVGITCFWVMGLHDECMDMGGVFSVSGGNIYCR